MVYRINKDYAKKFNGNDGRRFVINLHYNFSGRDLDNNLVTIREGKAQDPDGILNILTEFGFLEEVDSEEEEEEEQDSEESFHDQLFQAIFFPKVRVEDQQNSSTDSSEKKEDTNIEDEERRKSLLKRLNTNKEFLEHLMKEYGLYE